MIIFTFSFDFFENANTYHLLMLYQLCNDFHCEHRVAVDKDIFLPELYLSRCKDRETIRSWVNLITNRKCKFDKAPYSIDPNSAQDKDILDLTSSLVGEKMMVVDSLQSTSSYAGPCVSNSKDYVRIVDCKYADALINNNEEKIKQLIINNHCIIANKDATIKNSKVQ